MIILKTNRELQFMKRAGRVAANALKIAGEVVEPGVSTWEIDRAAHKYIESEGAEPTFLGYGGFPATCCISVNQVVIHGIPSKKQIIQEGDIVSIDVGATLEGYVGDNAWTFPCGKVSEEAQRLMDTTRESLFEGIKAAQPNILVKKTLSDFIENKDPALERAIQYLQDNYLIDYICQITGISRCTYLIKYNL